MTDVDLKPPVVPETAADEEIGVAEGLGVLKEGVEGTKTKEVIKTDLKGTIIETTKALKEYIKDPEKRKELLTVVGIGVLAWLFKPEKDLEDKENGDEETKKEVEKLASEGLLEGEVKAAEGEAIEFKIENTPKFFEAYKKALTTGYPDIDINSISLEETAFKGIFASILEAKVSFDAYDIKAWEDRFKDLVTSGLVTKEELRKIYPYAENIDTERSLRYTTIQLKACMNKTNTKQLMDMGIIVPENVRAYTSISMFPHGIGDYDSFKATIFKNLLPGENNPAKQVTKATEILGRCALGKYQVLPKHHFGRMGWEWKGEDGLKKIYEFLTTPGMQESISMEIIKGMAQTYEGNPYAMATAYYAGAERGRAMLQFRKAVDAGQKVELSESMTRAQVMGGGTFGSINHYAEKAVSYYGRGKVDPNNPQDVADFQRAIAKKETGFLEGKKAKNSTVGVSETTPRVAAAKPAAAKEAAESVKAVVTFEKAMEVFQNGTRQEKDELAKKLGYPTLKEVQDSYASIPEGKWQENQSQTLTDFEAGKRTNQFAITLDICSNYGEEKTNIVVSTIDEAITKEIPVTLFVTGNALNNERIRAKIAEASKKPYIRIANHGFRHRPFASQSIDASDGSAKSGQGKKWGQKVTGSLEELYDETVGGAIAIQSVTGKKPEYIRPGTLWTTEKGARIAAEITGARLVGRSSHEGKTIDDAGGSRAPGSVLARVEAGDIFLGHGINRNMAETFRNMEKDNRGVYVSNKKGEKVYLTNLA
jgi:hypothetical protein